MTTPMLAEAPDTLRDLDDLFEDAAASSGLSALRTRVANHAATLAEIVTDGFDGFHLGAGDYTVQLMAPEGPSTRGGAHARQTIRLTPRRRGYTSVVVGTVDPVRSTADIRRYDHVSMIHELRFGRPLEIDADEYAAFIAKLDTVFKVARIHAKHLFIPQELVVEHQTMLKRTKARWSWLGVLVAFSVVALIAFALLRAR